MIFKNKIFKKIKNKNISFKLKIDVEKYNFQKHNIEEIEFEKYNIRECNYREYIN